VCFGDSTRYVQFCSLPGGSLLGEAVSNDNLIDGERLGRATIQRLRELGWRKHGKARLRNFSRRWTEPVPVSEIAELVVKTLANGYGAQSPSHLEITLGSFNSAEHPYSKLTMMSDLPELQLTSGLLVRNTISGNAYRIRMPLGAGGYGAVYRVSQIARSRISRACVLKVTLEPTEWHREAYFGDLLKRERAVVRIYESFAWIPAGASKPLYCLVSELMYGGDVRHYLSRHPQPWKEPKVRHEVISILRALRLLHQGGAVHRDLTPRNIFVTTGRQLKIGDFGLALHGIARNGVVADAFNPAYAPPAVLAGEATHWSPEDDVFHVGKLLTMLLSGRATPLTRREARNLSCSAETKAIIQRCIGEKRKRFGNASEVLAALEGKVAGPRRVRVSSLLGKRVVFTGRMAIRRAEARLLLESCGGACQDRVGATTDIVVVGDESAPDWIAEHKGNKLLDVDREWSRGHRIAVLTERRFSKLAYK
jgi:hypothetical protein